jgi:hypothetical protein
MKEKSKGKELGGKLETLGRGGKTIMEEEEEEIRRR